MMEPKERTYHTLRRYDGSVVVYYTLDNDPAHYVVYDTLDAPALAAEVESLRAENEMMRKALKPFAACAAVWEFSDWARVIHWSRNNVDGLPDLKITVDDLMAARAALRAGGE